MRRIPSLITTILLGLLAAVQVLATPITISGLYSTGLGESGGRDLYWQVKRAPDIFDAYVPAGGAFVFSEGEWIDNDAFSLWIAPSEYGSTPVVDKTRTYSYLTEFWVAGLEPGQTATVKITGRWSVDDWIMNAFINDVGTGVNLHGDFLFHSMDHPFTLIGKVHPGENTLEINVHNFECAHCAFNPTGLRVQFTGASEIPEPATSALIGLGLLGLAGILRRKRS